jgi:hypothetical protein
VPAIAASLAATNARIAACLEDLGFLLPPAESRCPHMFGAQIPERYRGNLVAELMTRRIYISQRGSAVRFAPHLHISADDLTRLEEALRQIVG